MNVVHKITINISFYCVYMSHIQFESRNFFLIYHVFFQDQDKFKYKNFSWWRLLVFQYEWVCDPGVPGVLTLCQNDGRDLVESGAHELGLALGEECDIPTTSYVPPQTKTRVKLRYPGDNMSLKLRNLRRQKIQDNLRQVTLKYDDTASADGGPRSLVCAH